MTEEQRRLAAIVFTDMVGYTALSQRDETHAIRLLKKHNEFLRSSLGKYRGKEVKTMGDAFLLEFNSALDATLFAVEIQERLDEHNQMATDSDRFFVRIGVHEGDVIHSEADVLGDAVNIASRIEPFADPGGICISESVFLQVRNKITQQLSALGEQRLKNVELPMNLYKITIRQEKKTDAQRTSQEIMNRIAVLPFENISPDPNDSYFADGLTEELITVLSQVQGLRVIAKTSASRFKGTNKGVSEIGNELRVSSILEGSVRKSAEKIRVTVQLIDATSEEHVWANQYDRDLTDIFSIQSDIAKQVSNALKVTLIRSEVMRLEKKETEDTVAHVAYLKGRTLLRDRTEDAVRGAKEQFELAIKHDPNYARAYAGLADVYIILGDHRFAPISECRDRTRTFVKQALQIDPNLPEAHVSLASLYMEDYRFAEADVEFKRAIALVPSYALAHHWYSLCLGEMGRPERLTEALIAEALDPLSPVIGQIVFHWYCTSENYEEALKRVNRIREIDPDNPFALECLIIYCLMKSDYEQSLEYCRQLKQASSEAPRISVDCYLAYTYAAMHRRKKAFDILSELQTEYLKGEPIGAMWIAWIYAGLNDLDKCFTWLEKAFDNRERFFFIVRHYPSMENARKDPRFNDLLRRAKLAGNQ